MLSIIIPVFNEQENIRPLLDELVKYIPTESEIIMVDDGSTDDTLSQISKASTLLTQLKCISLSRNFGHQNALMAGMQYARGTQIILMDGDLQHPPALIPQLLEKLDAGFDLVQTRRTQTQNISSGKKISSGMYYTIINCLSDTRIEPNVADFKAFNKKVLDTLLQFEERELFLRGLFSWMGFSTTTIDFEAPARLHGSSKYSSRKMLKLGLRGITSFSHKPLRMSFVAGLIISLLALIAGIYYIIAYFQGKTVPGWTSLITAVLFLGGIQLLAIGLLGEYLASIFTEAKKRPRFIVKQTINIQ